MRQKETGMGENIRAPEVVRRVIEQAWNLGDLADRLELYAQLQDEQPGVAR